MDYHFGNRKDPLILHTSFGPPERVPRKIFFRDKSQLNNLEAYALDLCRGDIIDIGAGAGCHSIILQELGHNPTALEISPGACELMRLRGVNNVRQDDIFKHQGEKYQTALLMMNGLGIAGHLTQLGAFLKTVSSFIEEGGQILADSSDISYLYQDQPFTDSGYYGELSYSYEYRGERDLTFPWLFVGIDQLVQEALKVGLQTQVMFEEEDQYLARLIKAQ